MQVDYQTLSIETHFSDENPTIRVSNLAEETSEKDLQDLFKPFGPVSRIYLAKDKNTGISKVSTNLILLLTPPRPTSYIARFHGSAALSHNTQYDYIVHTVLPCVNIDRV